MAEHPVCIRKIGVRFSSGPKILAGKSARVKNGKKNTTLTTIQKLADALDVSVDELLK